MKNHEGIDGYPLVSIVTVNYNQPEVTEELIKSLRNVSYPSKEVIVIDNGGTRKCTFLQSKYPEVHFIDSPQNLGFAGGNNLGLKKAKGEYILLLNNDTEVDPDFLQPMVGLFNEIPGLGIVSPLIIYHQTDLVQYAGAKAINLFTGRGRKIGHKEKLNPGFYTSYPTDLGHGAALMFPRELMFKIGYLPEKYFLYYEEHDWCEACKREGYKVYFQGKSRVFHKESISVGKANPLKTYYLNRNRLLFIDRNAVGIQKYVATLFYFIIAFPKNLIKYTLCGQFAHAKAITKALRWNLKRYYNQIKGNKYQTAYKAR